MDSRILILSRVREAFDRDVPTEQAVVRRVFSAAGTVTAAATVMVCVLTVAALSRCR